MGLLCFGCLDDYRGDSPESHERMKMDEKKRSGSELVGKGPLYDLFLQLDVLQCKQQEVLDEIIKLLVAEAKTRHDK